MPLTTSHQWRSRARWFVAEILIVVAGVLIALGVNAWWQDLQDEAAEQVYLEQILLDLDDTLAQLDLREVRVEEHHANVHWLLTSWWSPTPPPVDSVLARFTGSYFPAPRPIVGTARSIVASGDLRLIRNDSLRSAITTYLDRTSERLVDQGRTIDMAMEAMYDLKSEIDILEAKVRHSRDRTGADQDMPVPLPTLTEQSRAPFPLDVDVLYANREVYRILVQLRNVYLGLASYRSGMRADAEALRAQVEPYLKHQGGA